jgi:glycosyltransferase involved in cell wall biosynthesis
MKIALALEYPLMQQGGTEVLVRELLHGLSRAFEVVLVSGDPSQSDLPPSFADLISAHVHWQGLPVTVEIARALAEQLKQHEVQLTHFHLGGNFGWNVRFPNRCPLTHVGRLGIPVVTTIHMAVGLLHGYCGPQKPLWFKLALLPAAWLNKLRVLRHVRREIAVSQQDYHRLRAWYWPVRNRFMQIYHSRIRDAAAGRSQPERKRIILNVGHVAERKGQHILAKAFASIAQRYPDWKLLFAGHIAEESCREQIEQAAAGCPVPGQIQLLGRRDDASELMQQAAVFVQPSFYEGLPLALQEALYYGCACVATRIPGNVELIHNQTTGLLVPPGNPQELALALEKILNDPELRQRLGREGHASILVKEMTSDQMIAKHKRLYESLITQVTHS